MPRTQKTTPSTNGSSTRRLNGQFGAGNKFGKGNPYIERVASYRRCLLQAVSEQEVIQMMRRLWRKAMRGDVAACKVILERLCGRPFDGEELDNDDDYNPDERFL